MQLVVAHLKVKSITMTLICGSILLKPHSHPNGFYWGHQLPRTLTPANSMKVSIMQSDNCNRK